MNALFVRRLSRRYVFLLVILLVWGGAAGLLHAQNDAADDEPALEAGRWALLFQVGPDVSLRSFQGGTISAKRHLAEDRALRFGVTLHGYAIWEDSDEDRRERSVNRQNVSFSAHYLAYPSTGDAIEMYYGAGPFLGLNRLAQSNEDNDQELTDTRLHFGLSGVIGAEWFVRSDLSLVAEYTSALSYSRDRVNREGGPGDDREVTEHLINLSAGGVRAGVTLYF